MARATRKALDLALVSLKTVHPAISKVWGAAKTMVINSPAKPLVTNPVVTTIESTLDKITSMLVAQITVFRDSQLPKEEKYLEKELENVRRRIGGQHGEAAKTLKPACGTAWQYMKVECAPPMTTGFFAGPSGKKLENAVSAAADNIIAGLSNKIKEIDAEEERVKKEKEAAIKAAAEKKAAEELKKRKDAEMKAQEERKAKEKEAAAKKAEADKKAEGEKKPDPPKKEKKKENKKPRPAPKKN